MTKRAFAIYNDVGTVGVSLLVTLPDDDQFRSVELLYEDKIGRLGDMQEIADVISNFPIDFPDTTFHRAVVYGDMLDAATDVERGENDVFTGRSNVIKNPPSIMVSFKEAPTPVETMTISVDEADSLDDLQF